MSYETLTLLQGNVTAYHILSGFGLLIIAGVAAIIVYRFGKWMVTFFDEKQRAWNVETNYIATKYAYMIGRIQKEAKDKGVTLVYDVPEIREKPKSITDELDERALSNME